MPLSAAQAAYIDDDSHDQDNQIDAIERQVGVHQPRIHQGGDRQKDESEQRHQQAMISAIQVIGEEKHEGQHHTREGQNQNYQEARHG